MTDLLTELEALAGGMERAMEIIHARELRSLIAAEKARGPDPLLEQAREALWTGLQGDEMGEAECQRTGFPRMMDRHAIARAALAALDAKLGVKP